jgi:hypothetical protein
MFLLPPQEFCFSYKLIKNICIHINVCAFALGLCGELGEAAEEEGEGEAGGGAAREGVGGPRRGVRHWHPGQLENFFF